MKTTAMLTAILLLLPATTPAQTPEDRDAIFATLESWGRGWAERDAEVAVADYSEDADWTNAFGDRFQGRAALQEGLAFIFSLDFVMSGDSPGEEYADLEFLSSDIALLRSKLVRTGQKTSTGEVMADRHIHHLRVYQRLEGRWQIVSHLISQAQVKR